MAALSKCPSCDCEPGSQHAPECQIARCSSCGGVRYRCDDDDCWDHDPDFARWTGILPGLAEAAYLDVEYLDFLADPYLRRVFFIR